MVLTWSSCLSLDNDSVNRLVRFTIHDTLFMKMYVSSTLCLSMCLELQWSLGSLVKATPPLLSQKIYQGSLMLYKTPRLVMKFFNLVASFVALLATIYSDSHVESTTIFCYEHFLITAPPFSKSTNPDCKHELSLPIWKLASA